MLCVINSWELTDTTWGEKSTLTDPVGKTIKLLDVVLGNVKSVRLKIRNVYRHIRNYYLSNSKTFQDGNGNGNFGKINSNEFQDGNWESMEMKGWLRTPRR